MLTCVDQLLEEYHVEKGQSIYRDLPEEVSLFPITIGDFVETCQGEEMARECAEAIRSQEKAARFLAGSQEYQKYILQEQELGYLVKRRKRIDKTGAAAVIGPEGLRQLKAQKKEVMKARQEWEQRAEQLVREETGYDWRSLYGLKYKNTVAVSTMQNLKGIFPKLDAIPFPEIDRMPWFVSNIKGLLEAEERGGEIGMVGGPCLFGVDEVLIHLDMADGKRVSFDCSCGRRCLSEAGPEQQTLEDFVLEYGGSIREVVLDNRKWGITRQEYDGIRYLFAFASVFHARTVIPLPDMSYFKYMESDLQGMEPVQKDAVMTEFRNICYDISDMYLDIISKVAAQYPDVEYQVMHHRSEGLLELFYRQREKYIKKSSYMRKITNISGKKDAVIDYITMLALPWYLYGTRNVVQLDSVDETDSGRKCSKIHRADLELTQILYPEYLSRDMIHTIYNAPHDYKDYMVCE